MRATKKLPSRSRMLTQLAPARAFASTFLPPDPRSDCARMRRVLLPVQRAPARIHTSAAYSIEE
jgi:hypothetical protein